MPSYSVCVFCGARPGQDPAFVKAGKDLGHALAETGIRLVFGAGDQGVMGAVAEGAKAAGGQTLGVIPTHLINREARASADHLITETMHERKKVMVMNSDAIVLLPGGAGSLDEFFEVLTWAQLGLHAKPIIVANIGGYWDPLVALIDHVIGSEFADNTLRSLVKIAADVAETKELLLTARDA